MKISEVFKRMKKWEGKRMNFRLVFIPFFAFLSKIYTENDEKCVPFNSYLMVNIISLNPSVPVFMTSLISFDCPGLNDAVSHIIIISLRQYFKENCG